MDIKVLASGSGGNAYLIEQGRAKLLIECGIPFKTLTQKLYAEGITCTQLDGCLVSHSHKDHCRCVKQLLDHGVDCYMSTETAGRLGVLDNHRVKVSDIEPNTHYLAQIENWKVVFFEAIHDVNCQGFLIVKDTEKLLYLSDSAYSKYTFPGINYMMLGCNYDLEELKASGIDRRQKARIMKSHASIETVKELLRSNDLSKLKEVHLIHMSDRTGNEEKFKRAIQEIVGVPVYTH